MSTGLTDVLNKNVKDHRENLTDNKDTKNSNTDKLRVNNRVSQN